MLVFEDEESMKMFEIAAVWKLTNGRFFVHWHGYDNVDDMTIEPESAPMTAAMEEQTAEFLSTYPWRSGAEALEIKSKFLHCSLDEIRDSLAKNKTEK